MSMRMPATNEPGYRDPSPEGDADTFSVIDRNSIFDGPSTPRETSESRAK